jgi:excisionase family DNA binding protein
MNSSMRLSPQDDLISVSEAARLKEVTRSAIYIAIREGRLPHIMVVGHYALRKADVLAWTPQRYTGRQKGLPLKSETKARISDSQKRRWAQRRQKKK